MPLMKAFNLLKLKHVPRQNRISLRFDDGYLTFMRVGDYKHKPPLLNIQAIVSFSKCSAS
jgi:hypothetical protein